jgi:hypothetical protein
MLTVVLKAVKDAVYKGPNCCLKTVKDAVYKGHKDHVLRTAAALQPPASTETYPSQYASDVRSLTMRIYHI